MNTMVTECETSSLTSLIGAYNMNDIVRRVESDEDKVKLVNLWTRAHAMKRELDTLRALISAVKNGNDLPY